MTDTPYHQRTDGQPICSDCVMRYPHSNCIHLSESSAMQRYVCQFYLAPPVIHCKYINE